MIIDALRKAAELGKLVVFVGSGVSCNVEGMPSWYDLVVSMAKEVGYSHCGSCGHKKEHCEEFCRYKDEYTTDEFLKIPQYAFNQDSEKYQKIISDSFKDAKFDSPLSYEIFEISLAHIITTNYDTLLESSSHITRDQWDIIVHDKDLLNAVKRKYIIKMHGDINDAETIVLKEEDYLNYSQKHVLIEMFVKSLLVDHTILFLGYSLKDYNIKLIVSWINYMKKSNDADKSNKKIGYIIIDQENDDATQNEYFSNYNIETVNIHEIPLVSDIPESLNQDMGKRLYSFLRSISTPAIDYKLFGSSVYTRSMIDFLYPHKYVNYTALLDFLNIRRFLLINHELRLVNEEDYNAIKAFIDIKDEYAQKLEFLFVNAGIYKIYSSDESHYIDLDDKGIHQLFDNHLLNLYLDDDYVRLDSAVKAREVPIMDKSFYSGMINGYNEIIADYSKIDYTLLSTDDKVAFLHNSALLEFIRFLKGFDMSKAKSFIESLPQKRDQDLYRLYLDMYSGNKESLFMLKESLEKIKHNITQTSSLFFGGSVEPINEMRNTVIKEYLFYFSNNLFFNISADAAILFRPYIEAVICSNCELAARDSGFEGLMSNNRKYRADIVDFDLMTKFISTKDLCQIMQMYNLKTFIADIGILDHLVGCYENLCHSISDLHKFGYKKSFFVYFSNLALVISKVPISNNEAQRLAGATEKILADAFFSDLFFSTDMPDFRSSLDALSALCILIPISPCFETVKRIIASPNFYDYAINVNFTGLKKVIRSFLIEENADTQEEEICTIIETENDIHRKICLLRLLFPYIHRADKKEAFSKFILDNFDHISTHAVYDFVLNSWVIPSEEQVIALLQKTVEAEKRQKPGVHLVPDPVQVNLECVYILYLNETIKDLSPLRELKGDYPHLQFLLDPETFDYTKVDFSNYMWVNFARRERFMDFFVKHSKEIKPGLIESLKNGEAGENERKILYGFMADADELWSL